MWDLPRSGLEPVSPALAGGFLSTAPPGKSRLQLSISDICLYLGWQKNDPVIVNIENIVSVTTLWVTSEKIYTYILWNKAISRKCLKSSDTITFNLGAWWKHQGPINQLYSDVQARSQSGDQAHLQSPLAPGLPSAEGQQVAEAGLFVELYRRPDQSHRGAVVRSAWPRRCGQEAFGIRKSHPYWCPSSKWVSSALDKQQTAGAQEWGQLA